MNIRLAQLNPTIGDIRGNTDKVIASIDEAKADGFDLLIFNELITCGYPPMDLLERKDFLEAIYEANNEILTRTHGITIIYGTVKPNPSSVGRKIFNSAIVARDGIEIAQINKTLLPTYDIFDDLRYFEPNNEFQLVDLNGIKFGISICEDIWYNDNEIQYHNYDVNPIEKLCELGAELIVNVSASPYSKTKTESRSHMLCSHSKEFGKSVLYVNQVGANTEIIFDGDSLATDSNGEIIARAPIFEEANLDLFFDGHLKAMHENAVTHQLKKEEQLFKSLVFGLREYLAKTELTSDVLLGLSGGIDSALVSVIATEAMGPKHVHVFTMPSEFSSEGSVNDSVQLAKNLGINIDEISIREIYDQFIEKLNPVFEGTDFGVAEENIQSRIRGSILMAISNKFGYMLLNTGNKSEYAVGYCTLYGDMNGGLALLSDVYKTEVYDICRWLNDEYYKQEIIPQSIIDKAPSAELRPDQKDSDSLPEYDILDKILFHYIEEQYSREQIVNLGIDEDITDKVIRMVDYNEHKRFQAAPGLRVSSKAFGSGRRWPIVQGWTRQDIKSLT